MGQKVIINGVDFTEPLTPAEVAAFYRVDAKTVTRWAQAGKIDSFRTPGGHRRFSRAQVESLLRGEPKNGVAQ